MWSRSLALALLLLPAPALADVKEDVAALAPQGLVLVMDAQGNELVAQNTDEPFVPASVTKIVTAWLAMEVLGGDYRFKTRFYLDDKRVLYVRGSGDPFLISEELAPLATNWSRRSARSGSPASCWTRATTLRTSASRASRTRTRPTMR
ncbi:MAG: D-alanyl-D-alanine carboxypeptidase [Pseudomonadota bacterium]